MYAFFIFAKHLVPYRRCQVIASADIQLQTQHSASLYAGQPISTVLTIHTSFYWGDVSADDNLEYLLRFDVAEMTRDWLVSGQKRGDFIARVCIIASVGNEENLHLVQDNQKYSVALTLVALRHGELQPPVPLRLGLHTRDALVVVRVGVLGVKAEDPIAC